MKEQLTAFGLTLLRWLVILLAPFAWPYRIPTWKPRSFGGKGTGALTWLSILLVYPYAFDGTDAFVWSWLALILCAYIQMFSKWVSTKPARDEGKSHAWAGRYEPLFAFGFVLAARHFVNAAAGNYFLAGYVASVAQIWVVRLHRLIETGTPEAKARALKPLRMARSAIAYIFGRRPQPQLAGPAMAAMPLPRRTFMGWVSSHIVAHFIISAISGILGFNAIVALFALICAVPLWFMGADVKLPAFVKTTTRGFLTKAKDVLADAKEEAVERLDDKKTQLVERLEDNREEMEDKVRSEVRSFFSDIMFK